MAREKIILMAHHINAATANEFIPTRPRDVQFNYGRLSEIARAGLINAKKGKLFRARF